jgi:hypothetical protein
VLLDQVVDGGCLLDRGDVRRGADDFVPGVGDRRGDRALVLDGCGEIVSARNDERWCSDAP